MQFSRTDLSIRGLWYPQRVLEVAPLPPPMGTSQQLLCGHFPDAAWFIYCLKGQQQDFCWYPV